MKISFGKVVKTGCVLFGSAQRCGSDPDRGLNHKFSEAAHSPPRGSRAAEAERTLT